LQIDVHDTRRRLERATKGINDNKKLPESEKKKILAFDEFLAAKGFGEKRRLQYLLTLPRLRGMLGKNFRATSKEDIVHLLAKIEKQPLEEWTKHTYRVVTKKFYQWLHEMDGADYPSQVSWIHSRVTNSRHILPEELLNAKDLQALLDAAEKDPRDKAFIMTLMESGCRVGEILALRIKHVAFDDYGAVLHVSGKTGERRVRVVSAAPLLAGWLTHHPHREDPDTPLWTQSLNEPFTYDAARVMLRRRADDAMIKKRVNPHLFRHSQASTLAEDLTEAQMNEYFGWKQGSKMPAIYVHLSGRNIDEKILEMKGLKKPDKRQVETAVKECLRCGHVNPPTGKYCMKCALPLDLKSVLEVEEKRKRNDSTVNILFADAEVQELLVQKIKQYRLG
jgi:integrase